MRQQRKCRTDTYKNVKDSIPSSLQSVLAWIHVKHLKGEKKTEASSCECVITLDAVVNMDGGGG